MSILVKGIDMPTDGNGIFIDWQGNVSMIGDEIKDVPTAHAIEVLPHGDLIDKNHISELLDTDRHNRNIYQLVWNDAINTVIQTMPTIIEAEEGAND